MATFAKLLAWISLWTIASMAMPSGARSQTDFVADLKTAFSGSIAPLEAIDVAADFPVTTASNRILTSGLEKPCFEQVLLLSDASLKENIGPVDWQAVTFECGPQKETARSSVPLGFFPAYTCGSSSFLDISAACFTRPVLNANAWSIRIFSEEALPLVAARPKKESFHWRPALVQSFEFLVMEHAFRLANDPYARYLLFHKPFWKDYLSSAQHFDMTRWGDGDDFLVNYIGHPLEGSVSGNIFIQNDPKGRSARFGKSSAYWQSRFKSLAWSAVYSAYFEIGPILSEAALGNEGGYTYIPGCGFYPTCEKVPGQTYKPPTNNTGWVDFVITPVVGMGWTVLEDFLDVQLVDRIAGGHDSAAIRIFRGAITPSRSMANMLAGAPPWRRFSETKEVAEAFGSPVRAAPKWEAWRDNPRWGLGLHVTSASFPMDWNGCSGCRTFVPGIGLDLGYRLTQYVYFDSEFNAFPGSSSAGGRGAAAEALAGLKIGHTSKTWGIFSQVRPGFIRYQKALVPGSSTEYEGTTRFALDLGGSVEYYASRRSTIRFNMGTTLVHYLTGHPDPQQPPVSVLSDDYYTTVGSFRVTSGYVYRF